MFITIRFGWTSFVEILILPPAFMNKDVMRMIRVPATSKLTFEAKKVRFKFYLYILKMRLICWLVRCLNYGNSFLKRVMFALRFWCILMMLSLSPRMFAVLLLSEAFVFRFFI